MLREISVAWGCIGSCCEYSGSCASIGVCENEDSINKGDSLLVIHQIKKEFKVKAPTIIPLYREAMSLISKFKHIQIEWIPRGKNKEADKLTCRAYEDAIGDST